MCVERWIASAIVKNLRISVAGFMRSPYNSLEVRFMRIGFDDMWRLPAGMEVEEHPEPLSPMQPWRVIGPEGEVLGKLRAKFSDEELMLLFPSSGVEE
jgi:hypothetical protein